MKEPDNDTFMLAIESLADGLLGGRHHDVVLFGMTAPEFAARHPFPGET